MKTVTIATEHSLNNGEKITIKLQGGSPYYTYIWIDDVCYTFIKTNRSFKLEKTKL